MTSLRSRKVGSCGQCAKWRFDKNNWGTCTSVNENSEVRGHVLELEVPAFDAWLNTRVDFGCRQWQELDIWKA